MIADSCPFVMIAVSPLPIIKNAAESEQIAADARMDRMTIWMRNVESKWWLVYLHFARL